MTGLNRRERLGAGLVAGLVQLGLLVLLLRDWRQAARPVSPAPSTVSLIPIAPPPLLQHPSPHAKAERAPAPPARRAEATPVVAPPPIVPLRLAPPIVAAPAPAAGAAPKSGAAIEGSGSGAGGEGTGAGAGGAGGEGDEDLTPPRWRHGKLKDSDYPPAAAERNAGGTVSVVFTVEENGRVDGCTVVRSSGDADLDATTCRLIEQRYRYEPARDPDGRPVAVKVGEDHSWSVRRETRAEVSPPPP